MLIDGMGTAGGAGECAATGRLDVDDDPTASFLLGVEDGDGADIERGLLVPGVCDGANAAVNVAALFDGDLDVEGTGILDGAAVVMPTL
jgi:hypothetical protein